MKNYKYLLSIILTTVCLLAYPTEWDLDGDGFFDNITDYQNSMSSTSAVFLEGNNVGSSGDALAAFVDGEQRGFQADFEVGFGPYVGTSMFPILVYSNASSGETVYFQFYDAETGLVYNIYETLDFVSDDTLGNFVSPTVLNTDGVDGGGSGVPTDGCDLPENTVFLTDSGDVL